MTHLPSPTIWPCALATGVMLFALGMISSSVVLAAGALLVFVSLVGWLRILTAEPPR